MYLSHFCICTFNKKWGYFFVHTWVQLHNRKSVQTNPPQSYPVTISSERWYKGNTSWTMTTHMQMSYLQFIALEWWCLVVFNVLHHHKSLHWGEASVAYLVRSSGPHERNSVILPPQKSPQCMKAALWGNEKYWHMIWFPHSAFSKSLFLSCHRMMISGLYRRSKYRRGGVNKRLYLNAGLNGNQWLTLIGVYHLDSCWLYVGGGAFGFLDMNSSVSSGIDTTAFLAISSLAPSSVDPFSPQRTCTEMWSQWFKLICLWIWYRWNMFIVNADLHLWLFCSDICG